jgi:ATP-dependent DNA helicase RecQ
MRFAEGGSCRHDAVLRYFGDEEETLAGCGRCDVCLRLAAGGESALDIAPAEGELIVRKALSGVARIHDRFGLGAAVALLRGAKDPRLERLGLQHTSTHGVLAEHSEEWLTRLLRRCVTAGWVDFLGGDRPVAILTDAGIAVMRGERPGRLLLPPERSASAKRKQRPARTQPAPAGDVLDETQTVLFDALRSHRLDVARGEGVPPYVVASDRTLREIAIYRPKDREDLLAIHGIGENKAERYGEGLLKVLGEHAASSPAR